jgi:molecular chaperone HscB
MDHDHQTTAKRTELQMARSMCWHCQSEIAGEYYCGQCVKVQPLSKDMDYFSCLGLPRRLQLDPKALEETYYELSRAFHPDFFQGKTDAEKQISLNNSALLNTAYRALKDPVQRAEYLLKLEAGSAKDIRNSPPADLFEEILELQEDLEAYREAAAAQDRKGTDTHKAKLQADRTGLEQRFAGMNRSLESLFARWDAIQVRAPQADALRPEKDAVLKELRELLSNRTYLRNILNDVVATIEGEHADRRH